MKTIHIIASVAVAAGLLSGCAKEEQSTVIVPNDELSSSSASSADVYQSSSAFSSMDNSTMETETAPLSDDGTGTIDDTSTVPSINGTTE